MRIRISVSMATLILLLVLLIAWQCSSLPSGQEPLNPNVGKTVMVQNPPAALPAPLKQPDIVKPAENQQGGDGIISGLVLDEDGMPAQDADVTLIPSGQRMSEGVESDFAGPGLTKPAGADGAFMFTGLRRTSYGLVASKAERRVTAVVVLSSRQRARSVLMILQEGKRIAGRVLTPDSQPVSGAKIVPIQRDGELVEEGIQAALRTSTGNDGGFEIPAMLPREWRFIVVAPGWGQTLSQPIIPGTSDVTIVLEAGGRVQGKIEAPSILKSFEDIQLIAQPRDTRISALTTHVSSDGTFAFERMPAGLYHVTTQGGEMVLEDGPHELMLSQVDTIRDLVLRVVPGGAIVGHVIDLASQNGIHEVTVSAEPVGMDLSTVSATTLPDGTYRIEGLASGSYTLRLDIPTPYFATDQDPNRQYSVRVGETIDGIDFSLNAGVLVSGVVTDSNGNTVVAANVSVRAEADVPKIVFDTTNEEGEFAIAGFQPGDSVYIQANTPLAKSSVQGPNLVGQLGISGIRVVVDIPKDVSLSGRVRNRVGQPQLATVVLSSVDGSRSQLDVQTDDSGRFTIAGFEAGTYDIYLGPFQNRLASPLSGGERITLDRGEKRHGLDLIYDEESMVSIKGSVADQDGNPVAGATIVAVGNQALQPSSATSNIEGQFSLLGLTKGAYRLQVMHQNYTRTMLDEIQTGTSDLKVVLDDVEASQVKISGRVLDAQSQLPVQKFRIGLASEGPLIQGAAVPTNNLQPVMDRKGQFALRAVPQRSVPKVLVVQADGYQIHLEPLGVLEASTGPIEIEVLLNK